jgi:hypothetical protein
MSDWKMTDEQAKAVEYESLAMFHKGDHRSMHRFVEAAVRLGFVVPADKYAHSEEWRKNEFHRAEAAAAALSRVRPLVAKWRTENVQHPLTGNERAWLCANELLAALDEPSEVTR